MITTVAVTGLSVGRISFMKMVNLFAPSIMPASSIEFGIALMKFVYRNTESGRLVAASTNEIPQ